MTKKMTFENTYTRYPFAPLVDLGLAIAKWLKRAAKTAGKSRPSDRHTGVGGDAVGHAS
ncbi:hypothetical protein BMS3Bbin10_01984 [bacterium BMS3Bbin10]|nr:hypothetical protein BMS3Bbin10_01984 [bacterium BMS3Bbin10]